VTTKFPKPVNQSRTNKLWLVYTDSAGCWNFDRGYITVQGRCHQRMGEKI